MRFTLRSRLLERGVPWRSARRYAKGLRILVAARRPAIRGPNCRRVRCVRRDAAGRDAQPWRGSGRSRMGCSPLDEGEAQHSVPRGGFGPVHRPGSRRRAERASAASGGLGIGVGQRHDCPRRCLGRKLSPPRPAGCSVRGRGRISPPRGRPCRSGWRCGRSRASRAAGMRRSGFLWTIPTGRATAHQVRLWTALPGTAKRAAPRAAPRVHGDRSARTDRGGPRSASSRRGADGQAPNPRNPAPPS